MNNPPNETELQFYSIKSIHACYQGENIHINESAEKSFPYNTVKKLVDISSNSIELTQPFKELITNDPIFNETPKSELDRINSSVLVSKLSQEESNSNKSHDDCDSYIGITLSDNDEKNGSGINPFLDPDGISVKIHVPVCRKNDSLSSESMRPLKKGECTFTEWLYQTDSDWVKYHLVPNTAQNLANSRMSKKNETQSNSQKIFSSSFKKFITIPNISGTSSLYRNSNACDDTLKPLSFVQRIYNFISKRHKTENYRGKSKLKLEKNSTLGASKYAKASDSKFYFILYMDNDPFPFRITIPPTNRFTLRDAKNLIPGAKRKKYRFFVKNIITSDGLQKIIFDEISNNDSECPIFDCQIVCKVFNP